MRSVILVIALSLAACSVDKEIDSTQSTQSALTEACSVTAQDCAPGYGCYPWINGLACMPAGELGLQVRCSRVSDCAPGLACLAPYSRCTQVCMTNADCAGMFSCETWGASAGVCVPEKPLGL